MNNQRIEEIQEETAYPDSISVQQALLKVWNETKQSNKKWKYLADKRQARLELLMAELVRTVGFIPENFKDWFEDDGSAK